MILVQTGATDEQAEQREEDELGMYRLLLVLNQPSPILFLYTSHHVTPRHITSQHTTSPHFTVHTLLS